VVDGHNTWRGDLEAAFGVLTELRALSPQVAVATSTSLLHVPHDVDDEPLLPGAITGWLAFADQKVGQVATLVTGPPIMHCVYARSVGTDETYPKHVTCLLVLKGSAHHGPRTGPRRCLVGFAHCNYRGGHTSWWCRECGSTVDGPPLAEGCSLFNGPAAVQLPIARELREQASSRFD